MVLPFGAGRPGNVVAALCAWANSRGWWPVTARIVRGVLAAAQRPSAGVGVSFQAMASPPWADQYYRGNSVEVFFDATKPDYLDTITNRLLPQIVAQARDGRAIGWFSLRFTARSDALLAMQQWERTGSVEVAVLRGIPGSVEVLRALEAIAVACNGRVHWGQQHDLEATTVAEAFRKLPRWRAHLASLCRNDIERRTFENEFPPARSDTVTQRAKGCVSTSTVRAHRLRHQVLFESHTAVQSRLPRTAICCAIDLVAQLVPIPQEWNS